MSPEVNPFTPFPRQFFYGFGHIAFRFFPFFIHLLLTFIHFFLDNASVF